MADEAPQTQSDVSQAPTQPVTTKPKLPTFDTPEAAMQHFGDKAKFRWDVMKFDLDRNPRKALTLYSEFNPDTVALDAKGGPGEYRRILRVTNRPGFNTLELYAEEFQITAEEVADAKGRAMPVTNTGAAPSLQDIANLIDQKLTAFKSQQQQPQAPAPLQNNDLVNAITALAPVLRPPDNGIGFKDLLALFQQREQQQRPFSEMMEMMKFLREAQGEGSGGGDGLTQLAAAFAPVLAKFAEPRPQATQYAIRPAPFRPAAPGGTAALPAAQTPQAPVAPLPAPVVPQAATTRPPFPGAPNVVELITQFGAAFDPASLTSEVIAQIVAGLAAVMEDAGGDGTTVDIACRYETGDALALALVKFAPQLAPLTVPLATIGDAFMVTYLPPEPDDEEPNNATAADKPSAQRGPALRVNPDAPAKPGRGGNRRNSGGNGGGGAPRDAGAGGQ